MDDWSLTGGAAVLIAKVLLSGVFFVAGISKLADRQLTGETLQQFWSANADRSWFKHCAPDCRDLCSAVATPDADSSLGWRSCLGTPPHIQHCFGAIPSPG
jgi:hypothetical protein